jgi:hypothetical protein
MALEELTYSGADDFSGAVVLGPEIHHYAVASARASGPSGASWTSDVLTSIPPHSGNGDASENRGLGGHATWVHAARLPLRGDVRPVISTIRTRGTVPVVTMPMSFVVSGALLSRQTS